MGKYITIGLVCLSINLSAQDFQKGEAYIKFSIGHVMANMISNSPASSSTIDFETNFINDIRTGSSIGVGLEYFISNKMSINAIVESSQRGIDLDYSNANETANIKISNNYLVIPISLKKYLNNKSFIEGGLYTGFLMKSEIFSYEWQETTNSYFSSKSGFIDENKEFTSQFDSGLKVGFGKVWKTDNVLASIKLTYSLGLIRLDGEYDRRAIGNGSGSINFTETEQVPSEDYFGMNNSSVNSVIELTLSLGFPSNSQN